jgi:hypothetical protein
MVIISTTLRDKFRKKEAFSRRSWHDGTYLFGKMVNRKIRSSVPLDSFVATFIACAVVIAFNVRFATIREAKELLKKNLAHAEELTFRNVRKTETGTVCGEVNVKQPNGTNQGFRYFYVSTLAAEPSVWLDSGTNHLAEKMCR